MDFGQMMKDHLSNYKVKKLAITRPEKWRGGHLDYHYILPANKRELNLLDNYRQETHRYINDNAVKLHQYFHHLNSSQAVCFNFFYPLIAENQLPLLLKILHLKDEEISEWSFEKMLGEGERTNFDFYLKLKSGKEVLFEIKYTEAGFGKVMDDLRYQKQYKNVYQEMLAGKIRSGIDVYAVLLKNYQLLRNIAYVKEDGTRIVVFICPKNNTKLLKEFNHVIDHVVDPRIHPNILMLTWESMLGEVTNHLKLDPKTSDKLIEHYREFEDKYFPN